LSKLFIFLGPPGAGKGTQASQIAKNFSLAHISTGEMLREHVSNQTELGKKAKNLLDEGLLVPDDLVINMLVERLSKPDCINGSILDGFPRTLGQAKSLQNISDDFPINKVFVFEADNEELIKRILIRGEVSGRSDDTEESIKVRLEVYNKDTAPLVNYYQEKQLVRTINAIGDSDEIYYSIAVHVNK
jgi:adenylate kinase